MGIKFHNSMGQRYAKHQMSSGVRLYHERRYQLAISRWRGALHRLRSPDDKFVTLGYLAQAFCDAGDYESMLYYSLQQMELANARHDNYMKSEAFLNLSKAYERLADFSKAIGYGRASLEHPSIDPRTPGYAHLAVALAQMGFSQFQASLEAFERSMGIASQTGDKLLELQVCVGLGALFTLLRDLSKALVFLRNALSLLQLVTVDNVHAKYKSVILYHLSCVLRIKGSLIDAKEACEESLRLSEQTNGRSVYARSLCSLADINRELGESEAKETLTKSWARYEQAFRISRQINDRMAEVLILSSMAKSASESRSHYTGQCECQAIQLNTKCLELSKIIGCKYSMMKSHLRLQELYNQLDDEESEEIARKSATVLIQELELFCNFCGQRFGIQDESLQALRCSHIFHERCLGKFLSTAENQHCPKCQCRAVLMDNIDSLRTSSASSVIENEPNLTALTSQAIASRPNPIENPILLNKLNSTVATRDVSTTMLDAIKPNGPSQNLNVVSTFVGSASTSSAIPTKPTILVQSPPDEFKPFGNCISANSRKELNEQKRQSAPVILPSRQYPISNHRPNCTGFSMLSEELFNETRTREIHFETLEELVSYQGPSVTDV